MVNNTNSISGPAMSVLLGAICVISPWLLGLSLSYKIGLGIIGAILIIIGVKN